MYFAQPWGLLALLTLPAIVVIHLYHRRFPPLVVAGLHLWSSEVRQQLPGRRREQLPVTPSLLLELLAALLLSLILSEPHFGEFDRVVHLVAILDDSASMSAKPPAADEPSFRDAAVAELSRRVRALPRGSVVTVIRSGMRPTMLAGPAVPWSDAEAALKTWQPTAPRHSYEPAWDLGLQLVEKNGDLLFLTDNLPAEKNTPQKMEVVSVGRRLDNVSIDAARWTFDPTSGMGRVFLRLRNHGRNPTQFEVRGQSGERSVFRRNASLDAGGASSFEADVPGGLQTLVVELSLPGDGLALDNKVELVEPKVRTVNVAISLADNETTRMFQRVLKVMPDVQFSEVGPTNLVIALAEQLPKSNPKLWWLGVGPLSKTEADRKVSKDLAGPYLVEKRNPLLEGIVLGGVVWGGVQPVSLDVTPLISAGSTPLFARLNGTRTAAFLLNIDLARSNLAESPDWPILLSNLVELRRDDLPGLQRWNFHLGEEVRFRLSEESVEHGASSGKPLTLLHGKKTKDIARANFIELPLLDETGIYEIRDGATVIDRFAVNFQDAEESDLRSLSPGTRQPSEAESLSQVTLDNPYSWAIMGGILLILLALLADWYTLSTPQRS